MKRIFVLMLALIMLFTFTACKKKSAKTDGEAQLTEEQKKDAIILPDVVKGTIVFTKLGSLRFEIYPNYARQSALNFIYLVNSGYYNGIIIDFIQKDQFFTAGEYGSKYVPRNTEFDYTIVGEFEDNGIKNQLHHKAGTLSWAHKADDNDSAHTKFCVYLNSENTWDIDGKYAAFGQIIGEDSFKVLEKINKRKVNKSCNPINELQIASIILDPIDQKGFAPDFKFPEPNFIRKGNDSSNSAK